MPPDSASIGIFDSGVGGLTVYRQLAGRLPLEHIIYLGDTARVPYGTKSPETVARYARACANILMQRGIKMLVVACNTASAFALDTLQNDLPIPVIGVIQPGAQAAARASRSGNIGVIGTAGTVSSRAYEREISTLAPHSRVFSRACPLFVPLAEEGWTEGDVPRAVAREYLHDLLQCRIDTLVLGCTHYPLLAQTIAQVAGEDVVLVDSAAETSRVVEATLRESGQLRTGLPAPVHQFLVTDAPEAFVNVAKRFLKNDLQRVEWVDF